jgi:hypothetical protein
MDKQSTDQTEAKDVINYKVDSAAATASATTQKEVKDDTTGEAALVGEPSDLALTADEQAKFIADCDASLTAILEARVPAQG